MEVIAKLEEAAAEERRRCPKPHPIAIRKAQVEINQIFAAKLAEAELSYWLRKMELVKEGLTPEQARQRLTELLTDGYDIDRAQKMKAFQDKIDPV